MQRGWAGYALEPHALQAALDVAVSNLSGNSWCLAVAVCWIIIHHAAEVHMSFFPVRIGKYGARQTWHASLHEGDRYAGHPQT